MQATAVSRRRALAVLTALAGWRPVIAAESATRPDRAALLVQAEAELRRGETAAAIDDFERASTMVHAPDAEIGTIRAAMQAGQYRRALAFCAHTAGEHLEAGEAGALYAWLLRAGGQPTLAERVLGETLARLPGEPVTTAVKVAFSAELPVASGILLEAPHRMAPWPTPVAAQAALPPRTRRAPAGAVLVGDGSRAVVPRAALAAVESRRLWVRNGVGETTEAVVRTDVPPALLAAGLAVLDLRAPLPTDAANEAPEPYAGSPGHVLRFAPGVEPGWPWLAQGFFGATDAATGARRLGFAAGDAAGAAVLDAGGRLAGIVVDAQPGGPATTWIPAARWASALGIAADPSRPGARSLTAPDAVYETGLRRPLQIIIDASG